MKIRKLALLGMAAALTFSAGVAPAVAADSVDRKQEQEQLAYASSFLDKYGVTGETKDSIMEKVAAGKDLDANVGVEPVSLKTTETETARTTVATYPDGSISVTELELPKAELRDVDPGNISINTVGPCVSTTGGSGFRNYYDCNISHSNINSLTVAMRANYTIVNGGYDQITWVGNGYRGCTGCTATAPTVSLSKPREDGNGSAFATASGSWTNKQVTRSYYMYFYVGGDTAFTSMLS